HGTPIGTWEGIALDAGKRPETAAGIQLTISQERIVIHRPGGDSKVWGEIVRIDPGKVPREIDFRDARGTWLGIHEVEGDRLRFVACDPGGPRPREFSGSIKGLLFTMKRAR